MGCGCTTARAAHKKVGSQPVSEPVSVRTYRIHPEWPFNMLRIGRGAIEDASTRQSDTALVSQTNEVVAVILSKLFGAVSIDVDEGASTDSHWKLAPSMYEKLRCWGALVAEFDIRTEGFVVKRYCQEGSPLRSTLEALVDGVPAVDAVAEHPAYWAITLKQLNRLAAEASAKLGHDYGHASMHDVVERVIKPATEECACSYARKVNARCPLLLTVFVSHCWRENFAEFVRCINETFRSWLVQPRLWICAIALFQTSSKAAIKEQLKEDLSCAPFTEALRHSSFMLVVRNRQVDLYSRIWCVWELFLAEKLGLVARPGGLQVTGPDAFCSDAPVDIDQCQASDEEDRARILRHVADVKDKVNVLATTIKHFKVGGVEAEGPGQAQPHGQAADSGGLPSGRGARDILL